MTNHPVFSDDVRDISESFVLETQEIFDELNNDLLRLEQAEETFPIIDKIFRAVHTVKGTSGFLSLEQLNLLSHRYEDVLNRLRQRKVTFHPGMMDVMFAAFDMMTVLLQQILDGHIEHVPMDGLLRDLELLAREDSCDGLEVEGNSAEQRPAAGDRPHAAHEEKNGALAGKSLRHVSPSGEAASWSRSGESVRVSVERLDELLSLVRELVLSRNRIARILSEVDVNAKSNGPFAELNEASSQLDATTSLLQAAVLQTRMVPVGRVFNRFQRVIRDLAKEANKEVELVFEGADIELDKSIVDEIGDSFLHLIRNAVDHGIELPADRERMGKPGCGRLVLRAEHDGAFIVITVEDDGAGIDVEALRRRAVQGGFADKQEAEAMNSGEIVDLIFKPGLTTSDQTTRISGRGVGMDVVRTAVTRLGGDVHVQSDYGRGTRFTLRVPLTLSIMQCLLVQCAGEMYAIPLRAISEVVAVNHLSTVRGRLILRLRDEIVPLVDVSDTLDLETSIRRGRHAVVVRVNGERLGLVVDKLNGQEEIVVKPLTPYLSSLEGFSGSTILGDGRIAMVLNVTEVVSMDLARRRAASFTGPSWGIDPAACAARIVDVSD